MTWPAQLRHLAKRMLWRLHPELFERRYIYKGKVFSIGIYTGDSPLRLSPAATVANPVLTADSITDEPAAYVADPFMCRHGDSWFMFFEILSKINRKGVVGYASSNDGLMWKYERKVLQERFHLAYPYVFQWRDRYYMIPDSPANGVRLYEASPFPERWCYISTILEDRRFVDSSILEFDGIWWLFTASSPAPKEAKTLHLFYSDTPVGTWHEHPSSPIVRENDRTARLGGRIVKIQGTPLRFAQDGVPTYGNQVRAFEVLELSPTSYKEKEVQSGPVLMGSGISWNAGGMHHIDAHALADGTWLACVDGWYSG